MSVKQKLLAKIGVRRNVTYGQNFHVGLGSIIWAPSSLTIGSDVYIGKNCTVQVDGHIGDGVLMANGVGIVGRRDHDYTQVGLTVRESNWVGNHPKLSSPVSIGSDVWIGFNAVVLSGVSIESSVVIAAGSVVKDDIPANSIVAGTPARVVGQRFSDSDLKLHWTTLRNRGVRFV